jgi:hypothetical protein
MTEKTSTRPGRYRHYKGNEYSILGTARHSETHEELVVYRQEYGDHGCRWPGLKAHQSERSMVERMRDRLLDFLL